PMPQFVINNDHMVIYWNKSLEEISGITAKEIIGTNAHWKGFYHKERPCLSDLILENDYDKIQSSYEGGCRLSKYLPGAYEVLDFFPSLGTEGKWLLFTASVIKNTRGIIIGAVETLQDITDRVNAEEGLKNSNKLLESIIEFLPDATFIIDQEKRIMAWNLAMEEMTGVPKDNMIGKDHEFAAVPFYGEPRPYLIDLLYSNDKELELKYINVGRRKDTLFAEVFTPNLHNGAGAYVWAIASPICDKDGKIIGAIESIRDITDHKLTEESLRKSEQKYRELYERLRDGMAVVDAQGYFTEC